MGGVKGGLELKMSRNIIASVRYYIRLWRYILLETFRSFFKDNCPNLSAAVAFYFILSAVPILFFILFVSGFILGSSENAYAAVVEFVRLLHPYVEEKLLFEIRKLSETSGLMGWVGCIFLLWISTMIFSSLKVAFTIIFREKKEKHLLKSMLATVGVIPVGVIAILFSIVIHFVSAVIKDTNLVLFEVNIGNLVNNILIQHIVPISAVILFFTLIFKVIPNTRIPVLHALIGGITCSALLEMAKYIFNIYLSYGGSPAGFVYGSLKALIYIVIWVYYLASITLFTAELISVCERKRNL